MKQSEVSIVYSLGLEDGGWVCNECKKQVSECSRCGEPFIDSEIIWCPEHTCEKCNKGVENNLEE